MRRADGRGELAIGVEGWVKAAVGAISRQREVVTAVDFAVPRDEDPASGCSATLSPLSFAVPMAVVSLPSVSKVVSRLPSGL